MPAERPTLDTVAAAAQVSRMTVSNAYNRPDQLSAATRDRVLAVAARLGYGGPNPTAASLRLGRTGTVGVVLTEQLPFAFADPGLIMILHGIATELSAAGNALLLVPSFGSDGSSLLRNAMVDALILCSLDADDPATAAALNRQVPLVTVGYPRLRGVPRVGPNNAAAAGDVARHLLQLGHTRFAVISTVSGGGRGPARPIFDERRRGFCDALAAAGVKADAVVDAAAADNTQASGRAAAAQLLKREDRPTAVFAVTDILALGVLDAAHAAGLKVGPELSVAGFDDIAAAASSSPPLTTVAHDLYGQGQAAARLALRRIAGEPVRAPRIEARLVARASTAAPSQPGLAPKSRGLAHGPA